MAQAPAAYGAYPANAYGTYPQADYSAYYQQQAPFAYQYPTYAQQDPAYAQAPYYPTAAPVAVTDTQPPLPTTAETPAPPLPPGTESSSSGLSPPPPPSSTPEPPPGPGQPAPPPSTTPAGATTPAVSPAAPNADAAALLPPAAGSAPPSTTEPQATATYSQAEYDAYYAHQAQQQAHQEAWAKYYQQQQATAAGAQQYDPNAYASHQAYAQQYAYPQAAPYGPAAQPAQVPWHGQQHQQQLQPAAHYAVPPPQHQPQPAYTQSVQPQQQSAVAAGPHALTAPAYIRPNKPVVDFKRPFPVRKATAPPAPAYTKTSTTSSLVAPAYTKASTPATPTLHASAPTAPSSAAGAPAAASAANAAGTSTPASNSWPPSLKAFVMRAFQSCAKSNVSGRAAMEVKLRELINTATQNCTIWTTDWDTAPMPNLRDATPTPPSTPHPAPATQAGSSLAQPSAGRYGVPPSSRVQHAYDQPPRRPSGEQQLHPDSSRPQHKYEPPNKYERPPSGASQQQGYTSHPGRRYDVRPPPGKGHTSKYKIDNRKREYGSSPSSSSCSDSSDSEGGTHRQPHPHRGGRGAAVANEASKRQRRVGRFGNADHLELAPAAAGKAHQGGRGVGKKAKQRAARLAQQQHGAAAAPAANHNFFYEEEVVVNLAPIIGTCQALEKSYFRLTSAVDPATVRPVAVLERALARLVGLLARGQVTYFYVQDQFKGMRQDLTVQHVRSELTVRVYEAHGRAALEYGEVADFNQCQTQLYMLYGDGLPGALDEFLAYRVLYQTAHAARGEQRSLLATLQRLPQDLGSFPTVRHALKVRQAVFSGDFGAFFRLYAVAPVLSRALMDTQADHVRHCGLVCVCKAMRPSVPVETMAQLLGFAPQQGGSVGAPPAFLPGQKEELFVGRAAPAATMGEAEVACREWMVSHGASINEAGALMSGADSVKQLFVPEDTSKVAHGDANLCIEDFFAKF